MSHFEEMARKAPSDLRRCFEPDHSTDPLAGLLPEQNRFEHDRFLEDHPPRRDILSPSIQPGKWRELEAYRTENQYIDRELWEIPRTHTSRSSSVASASSDASSTPAQTSLTRFSSACGTKLSSIAKTPLARNCWAPVRFFDTRITKLISTSRFHGWRMGVIFGIGASAVILCFNIVVTVVAANTKNGFEGGFAEPFNYPPPTLSRLSTSIHVLINTLSTILLAASNYTMQVLSSPTRSDLDKAHSSGQWFDIGVLSVHNLKRIPRRRLVLCTILGLSSIPLHLFYNSAAIYIATTNQYNVFLIDRASPEWGNLSSDTSYERLSNANWQSQYNTALVHHGDLYFEIDGSASSFTSDTGIPIINTTWLPNTTWQTEFNGSRSFVQDISSVNASNWLNFTSMPHYPNSTLPDYVHMVQVFAHKVPVKDRIVFNLNFLIIVIVCNAAKLATLLYVLVLEKSDFTVTLGDCAASFLRDPDPCTKRMCTFSRESVISAVRGRFEEYQEINISGKLDMEELGVWRKQKLPYTPPMSRSSSIGEYFVIAVTCISPMICTAVAVTGSISRDWGTTSDIILGRFEITSQNTALIAWLVNTPQLILSFCYLSINSRCTSIAGALEWNQLAVSRKGLRVTKPQQDQRNTYFLQLPYRWSLPIAVVSAGFHWLLSQSIFLVRIDYYDRDEKLLSGREGSRMGCGISGLSTIVLCVSLWILVMGVGSIGRRLLDVRIPFAASCSLVVSAACHPSKDPESYLRRVKWGVVEERMFDGELHCSLSSYPVKRSKVGTKYL